MNLKTAIRFIDAQKDNLISACSVTFHKNIRGVKFREVAQKSQRSSSVDYQ